MTSWSVASSITERLPDDGLLDGFWASDIWLMRTCPLGVGQGFTAQAPWPTHLSITYQADLEHAIGCGLVDRLMNTFYPYRGCALTLIDVGWDNVMSSEMAFYRAAAGAMDELMTTAKWRLVTIGFENPT